MKAFPKVSVAALLVALSLPAAGQEIPPPTPLPEPPAQAGSPAAAPKGDSFDEAAGMSDSQKVEHAHGNLETMRAALTDVLKRLEEARTAKDVIKLNCVNEKLTQVKGLLKISENSAIALEEGVARKEPDATGSEFRKISTARQRVDQLRTEAEECVGGTAVGEQQGTHVEVEEPQDLPTGNLTPITPIPPIPVVRPPAASPSS